MEPGKKISQYRKSLGISQEELGARLGVSRQAVSKWETGAATPDMSNLLALASEFGVSVAELTETPAPRPVEKSASHRRAWLWFVPLALLFAAMIAGLAWLYWDRQTGQVDEIPAPVRGEFALLWDGWEGHTEVLELGPQARLFPFGTTLALTAPEEVLDSDFRGMTLHRADCGAVLVEYRRMEADPELGSKSADQEVIDVLSTMTPEYRTPREVGSGSAEADLLNAYGDDLVYCLKEEHGYTLVPHDYYYAWSSFSDGWSAILFYMERGKVAGIRMENLYDLGDCYDPDNISRFPLKNGEPDFSARQEPEREELSDTRRVYIAFNQLVTNDNLTAEERYAYRRDIFALLPDLDWTELGQMSTAEHPDDAIFALMDWLRGQDGYSPSEILRIQMGCTAKGLDGAYINSYCGILSHAFFCDPINFSKSLTTDAVSEETKLYAIRSTAYDAELYPMELQIALDILDEALSGETFTDAETDWARLLRLYLITPMDERDQLPKTPAELP